MTLCSKILWEESLSSQSFLLFIEYFYFHNHTSSAGLLKTPLVIQQNHNFPFNNYFRLFPVPLYDWILMQLLENNCKNKLTVILTSLYRFYSIYDFKQVLGAGGFGFVIGVYDKQLHQNIALKVSLLLAQFLIKIDND